MAQKRELVEPQSGDKRYVRRDEDGKFTKDQVDVTKSLRSDVQQPARTRTPKGQGNKGDAKR